MNHDHPKPEWPRPAPYLPKSIRDSPARGSPSLSTKIWSGAQLGNAISVGLKIVDQKDVFDLQIDASWRLSSSHGKLVSFSRPWRTGPGTPKQAAVHLAPGLRARPGISSRSARARRTLAPDNFSSRTVQQLSAWSNRYSARSTLVPPTSPARIIAQSSSLAHSIRVRRWAAATPQPDRAAGSAAPTPGGSAARAASPDRSGPESTSLKSGRLVRPSDEEEHIPPLG